MKLIKKRSNINAVVKLPGSKSYTNRALIIAALAKGKTILKNPLISDDTKHMIKSLKTLGVKVTKTKNTIVIHGGTLRSTKTPLFIGNSGTSARFLTALAVTIENSTTITGDKHMQKRPINDLIRSLSQLGIKTTCKTGSPPLIIHGSKITKTTCTLNGNNSSQYLSALLMVSPYLNKDLTIKIKGTLTSEPFIDITIDIMKQFGVSVINKNYKSFKIKQQKYKARFYPIEPDMTAASYFWAAPCITGGKVKIINLNSKSKQGDINFTNILKKMGAQVKKSRTSIEVSSKKQLKAITIDMNAMPDVVQTLAVLSIFAKGTTVIKNIENLKIKETDRLKATATELKKLGAKVKTTSSSLTITPSDLHAATIETYDDHRMAMAFSLAGLKIKNVKIKNPSCVKKTFPDYWKTLTKVR